MHLVSTLRKIYRMGKHSRKVLKQKLIVCYGDSIVLWNQYYQSYNPLNEQIADIIYRDYYIVSSLIVE